MKRKISIMSKKKKNINKSDDGWSDDDLIVEGPFPFPLDEAIAHDSAMKPDSSGDWTNAEVNSKLDQEAGDLQDLLRSLAEADPENTAKNYDAYHELLARNDTLKSDKSDDAGKSDNTGSDNHSDQK